MCVRTFCSSCTCGSPEPTDLERRGLQSTVRSATARGGPAIYGPTADGEAQAERTTRKGTAHHLRVDQLILSITTGKTGKNANRSSTGARVSFVVASSPIAKVHMPIIGPMDRETHALLSRWVRLSRHGRPWVKWCERFPCKGESVTLGR